ncbi:MAG TPA: hypothetical protein VNJ06_13955 [Gemmatimonadales bacterium]|nr:hypothetical protein [Gemmatimonadales bacterium]
MEGWIAGRIRATSLRRVVVWTLALVGFVVVATSDRRYIANFLSGPYPLARAGRGGASGTRSSCVRRFSRSSSCGFTTCCGAHKKITRHSVNFIPTGKTYEAIVACYGGTATIPGKEKKVNELLTFVQQRAPWAIYGYSDQLAATFTKHRQDFVRSVEQRRQEWAQTTGKA